MRAGMAIRRNRSPSRSTAEFSPSKRSLTVAGNMENTDSAERPPASGPSDVIDNSAVVEAPPCKTAKRTATSVTVSVPNSPKRPLISLPLIPTGCTPPRASASQTASGSASPVLLLHPTLRSESDAELLGSPSPTRPKDLSRRVKELEEKLMRMAQPVPVPPTVNRQVSFTEGSPRRGRDRKRPLPRDFDDEPSPPRRRSVFSRLGVREEDPVRRSLSPESDHSPDREREVRNDVGWCTLVELGLCLSGRQRSPSPEARNAEGLIASNPKPRSKHTFPPSKGILDSLQKSFEKYTGGQDLQDCRPEGLPSEATTHVPASKFVKAFNMRFHGGNTFPLSLMSSKPSSEESSFLRSRAEPAVPINKVGDVEVLLRKSIRTMSSLDWLLATLREVSRLPHQDGHVVEALWDNIQKTLAFTTDFTTAAFTATLISRREAFLKACDPMKVPRRTHTWAALRPLMTSTRPSLLGDVGDAFRQASREEREMAIVNSLSSNRQHQNQRRDQGNNNNTRSSYRVSSVVSRPQASSNTGQRRNNQSSSGGSSSNTTRSTRGRSNFNRRQ